MKLKRLLSTIYLPDIYQISGVHQEVFEFHSRRREKMAMKRISVGNKILLFKNVYFVMFYIVFIMVCSMFWFYDKQWMTLVANVN